MLFTESQIRSILERIDLQSSYLVAQNLGKDALRSEDKSILKKFNIDPDKISLNYPSYLKSFLWGRLTALLSEYQANQVSYSDFMKYVESKTWEPLSTREKLEYEVARNKTYGHIKSFGNKIKTGVDDIIVSEDQASRLEQEKVLSGEIQAGVLNRKSLQSIVSNVGRKLKDWNKDWGMIVDTELQDIYNRGKVASYLEKYGNQQKVYKDTYAGACRWCIRLHTQGGLGSDPILFTLDELIANGSNIGKKKEDWKATVGPEHPFCRCDVRVVFEDQKWDKKNRRYYTNVDKTLDRKSKINIRVGEKTFLV